MRIFRPVDPAESSSQASYKILVKRSLRLHEENFSPVWATREEIFSPFDWAEIPHVIDKKSPPGLQIRKRMRRTLVYSPGWNFPCNRGFFFSPGWNSPCNQPLRYATAVKTIFMTSKVLSHKRVSFKPIFSFHIPINVLKVASSSLPRRRSRSSSWETENAFLTQNWIHNFQYSAIQFSFVFTPVTTNLRISWQAMNAKIVINSKGYAVTCTFNQ